MYFYLGNIKTFSRSFQCDSFRPYGLQPTRLLYPWDSPGKKTGVGNHSLLQGIFPIQGSNPDHALHTDFFYCISFPGGSDGKESTCNAGDLGSHRGQRRSPGERNGYPLQYSCLENPTDRGDWWATIHGLTKRQTQLRD